MTNMIKGVLFTLCILKSFSFVAYASEVGKNFLITGYYEDRITELRRPLPFVLKGRNDGNSWQYFSLPSMDSAYRTTEIAFTALNCQGNICNLVGKYPSDLSGTSKTPVLYRSIDGGLTWKNEPKISELLENYTWIDLLDLACTNPDCFSIGKYQQYRTDFEESVFLLSKDQGVTWTNIKNIEGVDKEDRFYLLSVNCHENICNAVGYTRNGRKRIKPLAIYTNKNDETWHNAHFESIHPEASLLRGIKCVKDYCTAYGDYENGKPQGNVFVITSHDNGKNWHSAKLIGNGDISAWSQVNSISCSDNSCYLAGDHMTSYANRRQPYIWESHDNGDTWVGKEFPHLLQKNSDGKLLAVSSDADRVIAVGDIYVDDGQKPIILRKTATQDWRIISKIEGFNAQSATLHSVRCLNDVCVVLGTYFDIVHDAQPLLIISQDGGVSWKLQDKIADLKTYSRINLHLKGIDLVG